MITTSTAFMRWILRPGWPRILISAGDIIDQPVRQRVRRWPLWLLPVVLSGCSMVQTVYNRSTDLAYWWIDGFVDVTSEQRPVLMDDLQTYQLWHRTKQLPRYTQWLQQLQTMALQDVSAEQSCTLYHDIWNSLLTLAEPAEAGTARLVSSLSAEQVEHLRNKIERHHRDWRRDWVEPGPPDVLEKRVKRARERAEDFYGRLDANQQRLLRLQAERSPFDGAMSEAIRLRRQDDIVSTLRGLQQLPPPPEEMRRQVRALLQRSVVSPVPAQQAYVNRLNDYNCRAMAQLHNSTNAEQRQAAFKRLQKYERDARALMVR